jgi:hypothetical protein
MAGTATEVYGPTAAVVDDCARRGERTPPPLHAPGPAWLALDPRHLRDREMFWFQLLSIIGSAPAAGARTILRIR